LPLVPPRETDANALIARPGGFLRSASTWRTAAPRMAESERALKAKQAAAVRKAAAERRQFDAGVRANKLKKEKEEQAKLRREKAEEAKRLRAAKATAQRQAREAAAAEAKRRREMGRSASAARAVNRSVQGGSSASKETPAQAFERLFAPIFVPPAVAKKRPDLVEKYQAGKPSTTARPATARPATARPATARPAKAVTISAEKQRQEFEKLVEANKRKKEKELAAANKRYAAEQAKLRAARDREARRR